MGAPGGYPGAGGGGYNAPVMGGGGGGGGGGRQIYVANVCCPFSSPSFVAKFQAVWMWY